MAIAPIMLALSERPRLLSQRQCAQIGLVAGLYVAVCGAMMLQDWGTPALDFVRGNSQSVGAIARSARGRGGLLLVIWGYWPYCLIGWGGLHALAHGKVVFPDVRHVLHRERSVVVELAGALSQATGNTWWVRLMVGLALALFCATVWPTPFRYHDWNRTIVRVNRFTGVAEVLTAYGWSTMRYSPENPFVQ